MPTVAWIAPVIDRTLEDCVYGNPKGAITAETLNRIENNIQYLKEFFEEQNIAFDRNITTKLDWSREQYFRISDLRRIEQNIKRLRKSGLFRADTPDIKMSLANEQQIYTHYNDIEQIVLDLTEVYEIMVCDFLYCGEFWACNNKDGMFYELGGGKARLATGVNYTVEQIGGAYNTENTTQIKIAFNQPVEYLAADKVTVKNLSAECVVGTLTGAGDTYYLPILSIEKQGTIEISIAPFGDVYCEVVSHPVTIYRRRIISATQLDGAATQGVPGSYTFAVHAEDTPDGVYSVVPVPSIPGITISPLVIENFEGTFTIDVPDNLPAGIYAFTFYIDGIESQTCRFVVTAEDFLYTGLFYASDYKELQYTDAGFGVPKHATDITFSVAQLGGALDVQSTTALQITFNQPVQYFTKDRVTVRNGTGEVTVGVLTGEGAVYELDITDVDMQGDIYLSVANFGDYRVTTKEQKIAIYKGRTALVGEQQGAVMFGLGGTLTYTLTSDSLVDGIYPISISGLPAGTVYTALVFSNGVGTFQIMTAPTTPSGKYSLHVVVDRITSSTFILAVTAADYLYTGEFWASSYRDGQHLEAGMGEAAYSTNVSFSVEQIGGIKDQQASQAIRIIFDKPVTYFEKAYVTVTGETGAVTIGELSGEGSVYTLELLNVQKQGSITVTIDAFAHYIVQTAPQHVDVYRSRTFEVAAQTTAVAQGTGGVLPFVVTADGMSDGTYAVTLINAPAGVTAVPLSLRNGIGTLKLNVSNVALQGEYLISIVLDGIVSNLFELQISTEDFLYAGDFWASNEREQQAQDAGYASRIAQNVTYTVSQQGGTIDAQSTLSIKLTFDKPVEFLTVDKITVMPGTGQVDIGTLTGTGTEWYLTVTLVRIQGTIKVHLENFGDFWLYDKDRDTETDVFRGRSVVVGEQQGGTAQGIAGKAVFPVSTFDIVDGIYDLVVTGKVCAGIWYDPKITVKNDYAEITIYIDAEAKAGKYYLSTSIDGIPSNTFMLAVTN